MVAFCPSQKFTDRDLPDKERPNIPLVHESFRHPSHPAPYATRSLLTTSSERLNHRS